MKRVIKRMLCCVVVCCCLSPAIALGVVGTRGMREVVLSGKVHVVLASELRSIVCVADA